MGGEDQRGEQVAGADDASFIVAGLIGTRIIPAEDAALAILCLEEPTGGFQPAEQEAALIAQIANAPLGHDRSVFDSVVVFGSAAATQLSLGISLGVVSAIYVVSVLSRRICPLPISGGNPRACVRASFHIVLLSVQLIRRFEDF
jgi:hypothetical protein